MSHTLVVFWDQMEFWFRKKPKGFYKFLKPCEHRWYKPGDSWCEQLRISENTFRKYQSSLCTRYASKSAFDEQTDPFHGKPYACYFDRLRKITVYFRNHVLADQLTREKILQFHCASGCVWNNTENNKNIKYPPKSPLGRPASREGGEFMKKNDQTNEKSETLNPTAQQMHQIWMEATQEHIKTPKLTPHFAAKLLEALKTFFQNSLERWKVYCQNIASSDFLMGKRGSFQAWLIWIIRGDVVAKVRAGGYGLNAEDPESFVEDVDYEEKSQAIINQQVAHLNDKTFIVQKLMRLKEAIGSATYISWFADGTIKQDEEGSWFDLQSLTRFQQDYIRQKFESMLISTGLL